MGKTLKAHILEPEDVECVWDKVEPILARVVSRSEGELETDDIFDLVAEGRMQLWIVVKDKESIAALVTQIITYPQKRVLRLVSLAGEGIQEFIHFLDTIVLSFAIQKGCTALELWGRKGWKKLLPEWKSEYIVYTKDIREKMQ